MKAVRRFYTAILRIWNHHQAIQDHNKIYKNNNIDHTEYLENLIEDLGHLHQLGMPNWWRCP
jgi:hypothetical protein